MQRQINQQTGRKLQEPGTKERTVKAMVIDGKYFSESEAAAYIHELESERDKRQPAQWDFVHYDPDYYLWCGTCTACGKTHECSENILKLDFCPHCGAPTIGEKPLGPVMI